MGYVWHTMIRNANKLGLITITGSETRSSNCKFKGKFNTHPKIERWCYRHQRLRVCAQMHEKGVVCTICYLERPHLNKNTHLHCFGEGPGSPKSPHCPQSSPSYSSVSRADTPPSLRTSTLCPRCLSQTHFPHPEPGFKKTRLMRIHKINKREKKGTANYEKSLRAAYFGQGQT